MKREKTQVKLKDQPVDVVLEPDEMTMDDLKRLATEVYRFKTVTEFVRRLLVYANHERPTLTLPARAPAEE